MVQNAPSKMGPMMSGAMIIQDTVRWRSSARCPALTTPTRASSQMMSGVSRSNTTTAPVIQRVTG